MPLKKGKSRKTISENIRTEMKHEKQFLNAFDLLNAIVGADMNGKTLICASIKADNVNLDLVKNGYNPL